MKNRTPITMKVRPPNRRHKFRDAECVSRIFFHCNEWAVYMRGYKENQKEVRKLWKQ